MTIWFTFIEFLAGGIQIETLLSLQLHLASWRLECQERWRWQVLSTNYKPLQVDRGKVKFAD